MNVGIIVDHPKRDLPGIALIAYEFVRRGAVAHVIPLYDQATDVPLLGLDALIVNFARPANLALVKSYTDMGIPVYVLDTEGGVLTERGANSPAMLADYIRGSGFAQILTGYFFWGGQLRDAFVANSGMSAERLHTTGCPRFDYCSSKWRDTLKYDVEGYVLVNANFSLVNPLFSRSPEHERDTLIAAGWQPEYVGVMLRDMRQIMKGFLHEIVKVARDYPNKRFLVRPHPFERYQIYEHAFAGCPNVVVTGGGSVLNVIVHSTCVLHLNCGTAIEALMLGRLPVSLEYLNTEMMARHGPLPSQVSYSAHSYEELRDAVGQSEVLTSEFDFQGRYNRYVQPWFYDNDGGAAVRIADTVIASLLNRRSRRPSVLHSLVASRRFPSIPQLLQATLGNLFGSRAISGARVFCQPTRGEKQIPVNAVIQQINLLAGHEGTAAPRVKYAHHPVTGFTLASITIRNT